MSRHCKPQGKIKPWSEAISLKGEPVLTFRLRHSYTPATSGSQ